MESDKIITAGIDEQLAIESSPYIFAFTVKEEGMLPDLKPGDIVIIDPNIKPEPGEIVLAKLENKELLLRRYKPLKISQDNGFNPFELIASNPLYSTLRINNATAGSIIGTLIEHRCRRRLNPRKDPSEKN